MAAAAVRKAGYNLIQTIPKEVQMDERVTKSEPRSGNAPYRLNVVIHGLWAIETNNNGIRMTTPHMHEHVVKAGRAIEPEVNLLDGGARTFELKGVTSGTTKDFDQQKTFRVPPDHRADNNKVVAEILLPYPQEIHSLREFPTNGKPFFEKNVETPANKATLVQVLVYDVVNLDQLELAPSDWKPAPQPDGRTINLHLYAEPDKVPTDPKSHVKEGYAMLAAAFSLEIKPIEFVERPLPTDPGIPGLEREDTMSLFEFGPAVSPPTCDMLIFDNTH
jgi:hypothetical protein